MNARDSAIFCHWPPESSRPSLNHLPSCVSYFGGSVSMKSLAWPFTAASCQRVSIVEVGFVARADVLAHEHLIADEVLEDHADALAQGVRVPLLEVQAVEDDAARRGLVEPREQLDERGLAGAVLADEREAVPGFQVQSHAFQRRLARAGVREAHVLEAHAVLGMGPALRVAARRRRLLSRGSRRASRGRGCPRTCRRPPRGSP